MNSEAMDQLAQLLREVSTLAISLKRVESRFQRQGDLPAGGRGLLKILDERGPQTVPQIARLRSTSRQNIQVIVNRLKEQGYVEVRPNPAHKRSGLVAVTDKDRGWLNSSTEHETELLATLLPALSEADLMAGIRILSTIRKCLAEQAAQLKAAPTEPASSTVSHPIEAESQASRTDLEPAKEATVAEADLPVSLL